MQLNEDYGMFVDFWIPISDFKVSLDDARIEWAARTPMRLPFR